MISQLGILFMRLIAPLPLPGIRAFGHAVGLLLHLVVRSRRKVVDVNLRLCFPGWSADQRARVTRQVFVNVAQAWFDRAWLWHGNPETVRRRLTLTGAVEEMSGEEPAILFCPHFVGLDAGVTAVSQQLPRQFIGIYTRQSDPVIDAWVLKGRFRFGGARPVSREQGVRDIVAVVRKGGVLYLLPDMNFGPEESIFVPFYGVPAATVPSLSRFSRLCRAKVVPLITRMTPTGYEVRLLPAWSGFPTDDAEADTALMNRRLEGYVDDMPDQYYWVHKRFKTRPQGEPGVY